MIALLLFAVTAALAATPIDLVPPTIVVVNNIAGMQGTGFGMKMPSGRSLIITNAHVCGGRRAVQIVAPNLYYTARVVAMNEKEDLCAIEAPFNMPSLRLAVDAPLPLVDRVWMLRFTEMGVMLARYHGVVIRSATDKSKWNCVPRICHSNLVSYEVSIPVMKGNSGTPLLNQSGRVVGVVWGQDANHGLSLVIKWETLKKFISAY